MKLSTQIGSSMSILAALVIIMGSFLLYQMQKLNDATAVISTSRLPIITAMGTINTSVADYRRLQFVHILSTNPEQIKRIEKLLAQECARLEGAIAHVKNSLQTPGGRKLFAEVIETSATFFEGSKRLRMVANEGNKEEARALLFGETKKYFEDLRSAIDKNIAAVQNVSHDLATEADDLFHFSRQSGIILILVALLTSAGLTFLIVRHVGKLLGKDPSELQAIAQRVVNGDYAIDDGKAKAGVYASIVSMVDALKNNIDAARRESENARQQTAKAEEAVARAEEAQKQAQSKSAAMISIADRLASMSEVMASASSQLAERISQADQATQESSTRLSDAAAAISQMNASVSEVASNASSAAQASTETKEKAEAGAHIVEKVVHSIEDIYQVSTALKKDMEQLNAHAQAINDIMVVISDIADQTNLLALNAAIEAARRGSRTGLRRGCRRSPEARGKNHVLHSGRRRRHPGHPGQHGTKRSRYGSRRAKGGGSKPVCRRLRQGPSGNRGDSRKRRYASSCYSHSQRGAVRRQRRDQSRRHGSRQHGPAESRCHESGRAGSAAACQSGRHA